MLRWALLFLALSLSRPDAANAGVKEVCMAVMTNASRWATKLIPAKISHATIVLENDHWIEVGGEIGNGVSSTVYDVLAVDGIKPDEDLVAKIPHCWRWETSAISFCENQVQAETLLMRLLTSRLKEFRQHTLYPQNPAWSKTYLPAVPIRETAKTKRGTILIKPKVVGGQSIRHLNRLYPTGYPKEIVDALRDIWNFWLTLRAHGVFLDINGNNLAWISAPTTLKTLGYSRPGIIFYEFGVFPHESIYSGTTFEDYLDGLRWL